MLRTIAIAIAAIALATGSAAAKPPLEAFGDVPPSAQPDISPDGKHVAYISRVDGVDYLAKYDLATGKNEALIKLPDVKAGGAYWVGPDYIILRASPDRPRTTA